LASPQACARPSPPPTWLDPCCHDTPRALLCVPRAHAELVAQATALGEAGDVDGALGATQQAEVLDKQHQALLKALTEPERTMAVCDICGVFMNSTDNEARRLVRGAAAGAGTAVPCAATPSHPLHGPALHALACCPDAAAAHRRTRARPLTPDQRGLRLAHSTTHMRRTTPHTGAPDGQAVPGLEEDPGDVRGAHQCARHAARARLCSSAARRPPAQRRPQPVTQRQGGGRAATPPQRQQAPALQQQGQGQGQAAQPQQGQGQGPAAQPQQGQGARRQLPQGPRPPPPPQWQLRQALGQQAARCGVWGVGGARRHVQLRSVLRAACQPITRVRMATCMNTGTAHPAVAAKAALQTPQSMPRHSNTHAVARRRRWLRRCIRHANLCTPHSSVGKQAPVTPFLRPGWQPPPAAAAPPERNRQSSPHQGPAGALRAAAEGTRCVSDSVSECADPGPTHRVRGCGCEFSACATYSHPQASGCADNHWCTRSM
jgi:hypothetical protein